MCSYDAWLNYEILGKYSSFELSSLELLLYVICEHIEPWCAVHIFIMILDVFKLWNVFFFHSFKRKVFHWTKYMFYVVINIWLTIFPVQLVWRFFFLICWFGFKLYCYWHWKSLDFDFPQVVGTLFLLSSHYKKWTGKYKDFKLLIKTKNR